MEGSFTAVRQFFSLCDVIILTLRVGARLLENSTYKKELNLHNESELHIYLELQHFDLSPIFDLTKTWMEISSL